MSWPKTEQEEKIQEIFDELDKGFKKLDRTSDEAKKQSMLKDLTNKLKDAKALIKEFEREGRTDGMPARELADRKRSLVTDLNNFIALKKSYTATEQGRSELMEGVAPKMEQQTDGMTMQELMQQGRKEMVETETVLTRAEKVVEDTMQIGQQTAATLHDQTQQLNKIVDDLNEIEFTMKKATKVITDIGRGLVTDKCIAFLLFMVAAGVLALIVVKIINPNKDKIQEALPDIGINNVTDSVASGVSSAYNSAFNAVGGGGGARKLLAEFAAKAAQRAQ